MLGQAGESSLDPRKYVAPTVFFSPGLGTKFALFMFFYSLFILFYFPWLTLSFMFVFYF